MESKENNEKKDLKSRLLVYIGTFLITVSIIWIIDVLVFSGKFNLLIFTSFVVGTILLLIGKIKPQNH